MKVVESLNKFKVLRSHRLVTTRSPCFSPTPPPPRPPNVACIVHGGLSSGNLILETKPPQRRLHQGFMHTDAAAVTQVKNSSRIFGDASFALLVTLHPRSFPSLNKLLQGSEKKSLEWVWVGRQPPPPQTTERELPGRSLVHIGQCCLGQLASALQYLIFTSPLLRSKTFNWRRSGSQTHDAHLIVNRIIVSPSRLGLSLGLPVAIKSLRLRSSTSAAT